MPRSRTTFLSTALLSAAALAALAACDAVTDPSTPAALAPAPNAKLVQSRGFLVTQLAIVPADINDSGVVVGTLGSNAYRYYNGAYTQLPRRADVPGDYQARAINQKGTIVGNVRNGSGLVWMNPYGAPLRILTLEALDGSQAVTLTSVNAGDVVVGYYGHRNGDGTTSDRAFRWQWGYLPYDLTPVGWDFARATDINDAGYIVGYGRPQGGAVVALRWSPIGGNVPEVLGGPGPTMATAIRDDGVAVGTSGDTPWGWYPGGAQIALQAPLQSAVDDVNARGRIVGHALDYAGTNPGRPWTAFHLTSTWLDVPNAAATRSVVDLRTSGCGSIVGRQQFLNGTVGGLLWTNLDRCDYVWTSPWW
jgi:hypothetical protein